MRISSSGKKLLNAAYAHNSLLRLDAFIGFPQEVTRSSALCLGL